MNSLAELLAPVSVDEFLGEYTFKRPLLVRGQTDKFESLFTWESLNRVLSYSRHDPLRMHLDRVDSTDGELEFTHEITNVRGERITRIDSERLYRHLRAGATLVVDAINEVDPAVSDLMERLAVDFGVPRATTVAFASFGHTSGFIPHWDDRDVYALQVEGQKDWTVFEPSVAAPLGRGDAGVPGAGEPGDLVWEGTLEKGDLLYVPRGWWHEVTSTDDPSLHLNVGFAPVTALDFLAWVADGLAGRDLMRMDIPRLGAAGELEEFERAAKELIAGEMERASLGEFLEHARRLAGRHTRVDLPDRVTERARPV